MMLTRMHIYPILLQKHKYRLRLELQGSGLFSTDLDTKEGNLPIEFSFIIRIAGEVKALEIYLGFFLTLEDCSFIRLDLTLCNIISYGFWVNP